MTTSTRVSFADRLTRLLPVFGLLLALWLTRLPSLDLFPFHVDEGIHTRWAIEVWHGHPFWNISDAKIIGHWPIAAFYPQNAAPFVARMPTVLIAMLGLAAGYALVRRLFGAQAAFLAGVLWIMSPYLFFYDRLALPDGEAGALGVVTLYAAYRLARQMRYQDAILLGIVQALAVLFKLTAAPYVIAAALIVLGYNWKQRWRAVRLLAVSTVASAVCFAVPVGYIVLRHETFFAVQSGFVGVASEQGLSLLTNITRFGNVLVGYGNWIGLALAIVGLVALIVLRRRQGIAWLLLGFLPLLAILIVGRTVFPRYYGAGMGILMLLAGTGLGLLGQSIYPPNRTLFLLSQERPRSQIYAVMVALLLVVAGLPFMLTAYQTPGKLPLPDAEREQYYTGPSSGFGISDAARVLTEVIERTDLLVVASMRPDSCIQANYYARGDLKLTCADAPGLDAINAALAERGAVYVLTDHSPLIGVDVSTLDAKVTHIADFPRPGEDPDQPSVVLWLVEKS